MESVIFNSFDGIKLDGCIWKSELFVNSNILLVHGITAERTEGGMFDRLANELFKNEFNVFSFSFRGHGKSDGTQEGMTISGEILDLLSAIRKFHNTDCKLYICASSFGAVATCSLLEDIKELLHGLILWNPVLDLNDTFLSPTLPWGVENFKNRDFNKPESLDYIVVDKRFKLGRVLFTEMKYYHPGMELINSDIKTLIVHGTDDKSVSYEISKITSKSRNGIELATIQGSDHGFDGKDNEEKAIQETVKWLKNQSH